MHLEFHSPKPPRPACTYENGTSQVNTDAELQEALALIQEQEPPLLRMQLFLAGAGPSSVASSTAARVSAWAGALTDAIAERQSVASDDSAVVVVDDEAAAEEKARREAEDKVAAEEAADEAERIAAEAEAAAKAAIEESERIAAEVEAAEKAAAEEVARIAAEVEAAEKAAAEEAARIAAEVEAAEKAAAEEAARIAAEAEAAKAQRAKEEEEQRVAAAAAAAAEAAAEAAALAAAERAREEEEARERQLAEESADAARACARDAVKAEEERAARAEIAFAAAEEDALARAHKLAAMGCTRAQLAALYSPGLLTQLSLAPQPGAGAPASPEAGPVVDWEAARAVAELPAEETFPACVDARVEGAGQLGARLMAFYWEHNRAQVGRVAQLAAEYAGREGELNKLLRDKYGVDLSSLNPLPAVGTQEQQPEPEAQPEVGEAPVPAAEAAPTTESAEVEDKLVTLVSMGFDDRAYNLALLSKHDFDLEKALEELLASA